MVTIVRTLWLAAERARFSCNDRALWKFFSARRLFLAVSKSYEREWENIKKYRQNITTFSITERKILAYRYLFSMSDEESHSARKRICDVENYFRCFFFFFIVFFWRIARAKLVFVLKCSKITVFMSNFARHIILVDFLIYICSMSVTSWISWKAHS